VSFESTDRCRVCGLSGRGLLARRLRVDAVKGWRTSSPRSHANQCSLFLGLLCPWVRRTRTPCPPPAKASAAIRRLARETIGGLFFARRLFPLIAALLAILFLLCSLKQTETLGS
jgi:hypothetical protein